MCLSCLLSVPGSKSTRALCNFFVSLKEGWYFISHTSYLISWLNNTKKLAIRGLPASPSFARKLTCTSKLVRTFQTRKIGIWKFSASVDLRRPRRPFLSANLRSLKKNSLRCCKQTNSSSVLMCDVLFKKVISIISMRNYP